MLAIKHQGDDVCLLRGFNRKYSLGRRAGNDRDTHIIHARQCFKFKNSRPGLRSGHFRDVSLEVRAGLAAGHFMIPLGCVGIQVLKIMLNELGPEQQGVKRGTPARGPSMAQSKSREQAVAVPGDSRQG